VVVGSAFFYSSGELIPGSAQGIADQLGIDLQNIPAPQPGKSYYVWLLADRQPHVDLPALPLPPQFTLPLLLTPAPLSVNHGTINFFYEGTAQHDDLFSIASRLLITEEGTHGIPRGPAADHSTWRYYGEIPQTPYGAFQLSAVDYIRHLFYRAQTIDVLGLPGGLDIWLLRNTQKLSALATSARDEWQNKATKQMHSQFVQILDYLDGAPNVHLDVPLNTPVEADPIASRVGLLSVDTAQQQRTVPTTNPPGYLDQVSRSLNGVVQAPDATPQMRNLASQINHALENAVKWLAEVRADARDLVRMTDEQLTHPERLALLNDLVNQANAAYNGQVDPATNVVQPGILQVHDDVQQLTTFTIVEATQLKSI
jgi:eukaryotic-like serine/threonine-protein kinase